MKSISSRQNPWFKRVRDAVHEHAEEIAIEGPKMVADAIEAGWEPIAVLCVGQALLPVPLRGTEGQARVPVLHVSDALFNALSETHTSQGVLGLFHRPPSRLATDKLVAALDGVQDPGNVGTIVRLAAAFDAAVALLPGCADPFSPKAIRASAGAILNVPIAQVTAQQLIASGRPLLYADAHGQPMTPPKN